MPARVHRGMVPVPDRKHPNTNDVIQRRGRGQVVAPSSGRTGSRTWPRPRPLGLRVVRCQQHVIADDSDPEPDPDVGAVPLQLSDDEGVCDAEAMGGRSPSDDDGGANADGRWRRVDNGVKDGDDGEGKDEGTADAGTGAQANDAYAAGCSRIANINGVMQMQPRPRPAQGPDP